MKRKVLSVILAAAVILSFTGCGKKKPAETTAAPTTAPAAAAPTEAPFVEEEPAKNELDKKNPIPGINKEYRLTEQKFEEENLILRLPEGVSAVNEGRGENHGHITVTDQEDGWKLMFRPTNFSLGNMVNNVDTSANYAGNWIKEDWSRDVSTTLAGFPARVWANNIRKGWLHPSNENDAPAVDIILDYGDTLVGEWLGMQVRLEALEPKNDTNIYHYLYNSKLRAVLNSFELVKTPDGKEYTANGITATFPARWPVKAGESSMVALLQGGELSGGITISTQYNTDLQHHVDAYEGEQFTRTYGDNEWVSVIAKHTFERGEGEEPTIVHSMYMFSKFNDKMCACTHVSSNSWQPEDYKKFLDNEQFVALMNSVKLDPSAWHQPGTAEVNGILSSSGSIRSYSGTDTELEIPAMIGEYNTVYIGGNAFKGNTTLKKVVIPEGVTEIQGGAFEDCTALEEVVLPDTLNFVYVNAFRNCPNLKDVKLPDSVTFVGASAFAESGQGTFTGSAAAYDRRCFADTAFETITLPNGADISADHMFYQTKASKVELPGDLEVLGEGAFSNTANIHEIELPETVRTIGRGAFLNMRGLMKLNLPEGIEELPENMTASTTTDVIVVPKSVKKIGYQAIYDANIVVLQNPKVEIAAGGIDGDYVYIKDAKNFVFDGKDGEVMRGSCIYLDGVYDPKNDIQGDFYNATAFSYQFFLPVDATFAESDALDSYLLSIGYEDKAWVAGTPAEFLTESTCDFEMKGTVVTGYKGSSKTLSIPNYVTQTDGTFWYTGNVYRVEDEAFAGKGLTSFFFRGMFGDGTGARILKDNPDLKDIWFNMSILDEANRGNRFDKEAFAGVPENVTVHLPASMTDDERKKVGDFLHSVGMPSGCSFDYYDFRGEAAATSTGNASSAKQDDAESTAAESAGTSAAASGTSAAADGAAYINDGTITGTYRLYAMMGMTLLEFSEMTGMSPKDASEMITVELKDGGKAIFTSSGEPHEVTYSLDGTKLTMEAADEKMEATLEDGLMYLGLEGEETVLARLTDVAFAVPDKGEATVWKGIYTKFVGDPDTSKDTSEEFSLELYEDGTGVHHRSDMDFKVTWELKGEDFTMSETFIGDPIVYTGTLSGNSLHLFNGDPENDFTCEYVYEK